MDRPAPDGSPDVLDVLEREVQRLLFAGSVLAASDPPLRAVLDRLATLASSLPALAPLVAQGEQVLTATPSHVAAALLTLSERVRRVRRAAARHRAPTGTLHPLPATVPLETELPPHEAARLVDLLRAGNEEAEHALVPVSWRGMPCDLRLLAPALAALEHARFAEMVAWDVLPAFGDAVGTALLPAFRVDGGVLDGRRLVALVRGGVPQAGALLVEALVRGSKPVRAAALALLEREPPAYPELEPVMLEWRTREPDPARRLLALKVLSRLRTATAFDGVMDALRDPDPRVFGEAYRVARLQPAAVLAPRLEALLTPEKWQLAPPAWSMVFALVQRKPTPALIERLVAVFTAHPLAAVRAEAAEVLELSGDPVGLAALARARP